MSGQRLILRAAVLIGCALGAQWVDVQERMQRQQGGVSIKTNTRSFLTIRELMGMSDHSSIQETDETITVQGTTVKRFQALYMGIPVYDAQITIETDSFSGQYTGQGTGRFVEHIEDDIFSTEPTITDKEAYDIVVRHFSATKIRSRGCKLIIVPFNSKAVLAYEVSFLGIVRGSVSGPVSFVDANTGRLLKTWENFKRHKIVGVGGNKKTGKVLYGQDKPYLDVMKEGRLCIYESADIGVYDMQNANESRPTNETVRFLCEDGVSDPVNGAFSPATDAFFYGMNTVELFRTWANISPSKWFIELNVHYGENEEAAYYYQGVFFFGDGRPGRSYPLVAADVVGHEIGHCFSEEHANLQYVGESGGIDESFADLIGEAAEHKLYGENNWIAGEEVFYRSERLRDMCDQAKDGRSITNANDFEDGLDPHYSSGVLNTVTCRLAKSNGWNLQDVMKVYVHANRFYWRPTSGFKEAACGILKASYDLGHPLHRVEVLLREVGIEPCDMRSYIRKIPLNYDISGLSASVGKTLLFSLLLQTDQPLAVQLMTIGGNGDVDLYAGHWLGDQLDIKWKSEQDGNLEIITIRQSISEDVYIILVPKGNKAFSDVKLKTKAL